MSKYTLAPPTLPDHLIWHKWQSYWTWISGFSLLCWVYYGQSSFFLIDPAVLPLAAVAGGDRRRRRARRSAGSSTTSSASRRSPRTTRCWRCVGFGYVVLTSYRLHAAVLGPRRADPHRRADGDDDDRQRLLRHHAQPAQIGRRADRRRDARPKWAQGVQAAFDAQQLHHAARAVHDAVEPLSRDLRQSARHPGDGDLRHRRRRADPLFLQHLARRPRQGAVVGVVRRRRWRSGPRSGSRMAASPGMRAVLGLGERRRDAGRGRRCRRRPTTSSRSSRRAARCAMRREPVWEGDRRGAEGRDARYARAYRRASPRRSACRRC